MPGRRSAWAATRPCCSPEYLTDTKLQGTRLVTKQLWTIAGTNVYMMESQLLNVKSPKPTLSSLMLRLIARVRALK
jgi:hypothetical protein